MPLSKKHFFYALLGLSLIAIPLVYRFRGAVLGPSLKTCTNIDALHSHLATGGKPSDYVGRSPLINCAAEAGRYELVAELLELGANVESPKKPVGWIKASPGTQPTALYSAVKNGHAEVVQLLLDYGADPMRGSGYWQYTPVNTAIENGQVEIIRLLFNTPNYGIHVVNAFKIETKDLGHSELVEFAKGEGLWRSSQDNDSAELAQASVDGDLNWAKRVMGRGASVNSYKGKGSLHWAVINQHAEIIDYLISQGANVNLAGKFLNETPLFHAAQVADIELVQLLIDNGAQVNIQSFDVNTPLHHAVAPHPFLEKVSESRCPGQYETAKLLIENGVDVNVRNREGKTALDLARQRNQNEALINLLLEAGTLLEEQ